MVGAARPPAAGFCAGGTIAVVGEMVGMRVAGAGVPLEGTTGKPDAVGGRTAGAFGKRVAATGVPDGTMGSPAPVGLRPAPGAVTIGRKPPCG